MVSFSRFTGLLNHTNLLRLYLRSVALVELMTDTLSNEIQDIRGSFRRLQIELWAH